MKAKLLSNLLIAVMIMGCLSGCNNGSSSNQSNSSDNEVSASTVTSTESTATGQAGQYTPSQEILDADLSSGLVQIGNDIFRNGGYMTINEFLAEYGDKYDTSSIDVTQTVESGWRYRYAITQNESGQQLHLQCKEPVTGNGTAGDAVIILFRPLDHKENVFYPSGISHKNNATREDVIALYEAQGLVAMEKPADFSGTPYEKFPTADNVGKYMIDESDTAMFLMADIELSEPNLYGITPRVCFSFEDYSKYEENYFNYRYMYYKDGKHDLFE